jgi:hypothetical protein
MWLISMKNEGEISWNNVTPPFFAGGRLCVEIKKIQQGR